MNSRRDFLKSMGVAIPYLMTYSTISIGLVNLTGCFLKKKEGPIEVHWDRDTCHRCGMVLSDRKYAVQIRENEKNVPFLFDDFGCAVLWLRDQKSSSSPKEFWVADSLKEGNWLNAEKAFYISGKTTPMGYGFAAVSESVDQGKENRVSYDKAKNDILTRNK